jgi:hypothetical protein
MFETFGNNFTLNNAQNGSGGAIYHDLDLNPPDF